MRILLLLFGISLFGCNQEAVEAVAGDHVEEFPLERSAEQREKSAVEADFEADLPEWTNRNGRYPYVCEEFGVRVDDKGRSRFQRHRKPWTERDRSRFRKLVALVAREMGADPKLFNLWALRESSYQPGAVHVLDPDVRSATRAWERHRWSAVRESELREVMNARAVIKDRPYWEAKGALKRIQIFRDNPYYFDQLDC